MGDDVIFRLRDSSNYAGELLDLARGLSERGFGGRIEPYRDREFLRQRKAASTT